MTGITPEHVMKILELTDSFSLRRESILIPLATAGYGSVAVLPDLRLCITAPSNRPFDEWLIELRIKLANMDLSALRH